MINLRLLGIALVTLLVSSSGANAVAKKSAAPSTITNKESAANFKANQAARGREDRERRFDQQVLKVYEVYSAIDPHIGIIGHLEDEIEDAHFDEHKADAHLFVSYESEIAKIDSIIKEAGKRILPVLGGIIADKLKAGEGHGVVNWDKERLNDLVQYLDNLEARYVTEELAKVKQLKAKDATFRKK
jgi:hypothetical protein